MPPSQNVFDFDDENVSLINESEESACEADENACREKLCDYESDEAANEDEAGRKAKKKLIFAALLSVVFMFVELTGGYMAGSLAIMSDGAHLITDSLTFIIGVIGISWGQKSPDSKMTFGYKRVEVFCAIMSIFGIWVLTLFILYFAAQRVFNLDAFEIDTDTMLVVSILGVLVNIVMAAILHGDSCHSFHHNHSHSRSISSHHQKSCGADEMKSLQIDDGSFEMTQSSCKSENINLQAAFLHVLGDLIQSIGVIIAAVVIKLYPEAKIIDPLITISFSIIVICTTVKIFKSSAKILLEAAPSHVSYDDLLIDLKKTDGVCSVHNLNVWTLSNDFHFLNVHIVIKDIRFYENVMKVSSKLTKMHGISKSTIQIEIK